MIYSGREIDTEIEIAKKRNRPKYIERQPEKDKKRQRKKREKESEKGERNRER